MTGHVGVERFRVGNVALGGRGLIIFWFKIGEARHKTVAMLGLGLTNPDQYQILRLSSSTLLI